MLFGEADQLLQDECLSEAFLQRKTPSIRTFLCADSLLYPDTFLAALSLRRYC